MEKSSEKKGVVSKVFQMRHVKAEALLSLRRLLRFRASDLEGYFSADSRLLVYYRGLLLEPREHNVFELLEALRCLRRYLSGRYIWRVDKVRAFIRYYEVTKFSGIDGRKCYKLTPIQVFQFSNILGWYISEERRLIREAIIFVPRKFSKTTSSASLAFYELLFGDSNAQAYIGANSYKQSRICFGETSKIVQQYDPKKKHFKRTREHIGWRDGNLLGRESFIECLTGGAETKDGLAASLVIMDEYAQARYVKDHSDGADLLNVLRSSMGTRRNPLTLIITTASRVPDGPFSFELDGAKSVLLGDVEDDNLFASIFCPDEWDMENLDKPFVWRKCNPHIGITVLEDFYKSSYQSALHNEEKMIEMKTKLLNIFQSPGKQNWISRGRIEELSHSVDLVPSGCECMASFDLSIKDDFSCVGYLWYLSTSKRFFYDVHCFIPEGTLQSHANKLLYEYWVSEGWLRVCPGEIISYQMIVDDFIEMGKRYKISKIGYDAYKSQECVNALSALLPPKRAREVIVPISQRYSNFTSPVDTLAAMVYDDPERIWFSENPIIRYSFGNAYIDTDKMENKKPLKRNPNQKIDPVITCLMDLNLWYMNK
jgi:phage terminase|nr:MAG TPA: Large Terminase [Caudoviricetes sp.]